MPLCREKTTLQSHIFQSLRQSSQQREIVGQGMEAVLLAALPIALQAGVEGVDVLTKGAVQAVETT